MPPTQDSIAQAPRTIGEKSTLQPVQLPPVSLAAVPPAAERSPFPVPVTIRPRVDFWKSVFTEMGRNQIALVAKDYPHIVFRTFEAPALSDPPTNAQRDVRRQAVEAQRGDLQGTLLRLEKTRQPLSESERELLVKLDEVRAMPGRPADRPVTALAAQNGIRELLVQGLQRFEPYADRMRGIFRDRGLPEELTVIPLFESYFNLSAVSSKAAVGPWQFLQQLAGGFRLRMDSQVDERRDPIRSTEAAAAAFVSARDAWQKIIGPELALPFAVVEHNVGRPLLLSAQRARKFTGIEEFVNSFRSKKIDYAAPNYYPEFVAMVEVYRDRHAHFPELANAPVAELSHRKLDRSLELRTVSQLTGLSTDAIRELNPALRAKVSVFPKGAVLHLPTASIDEVDRWLSAEAERAALLARKRERVPR